MEAIYLYWLGELWDPRNAFPCCSNVMSWTHEDYSLRQLPLVVLTSRRTWRSRHRYAKSIGVRVIFEDDPRPYYIDHRSRHVGHGERVLFELRDRSKLVRNHCRCMYSWSCDIHIHVQFLFANLRYVQRCLFVQEAFSIKIDAFKGTIVLL